MREVFLITISFIGATLFVGFCYLLIFSPNSIATIPMFFTTEQAVKPVLPFLVDLLIGMNLLLVLLARLFQEDSIVWQIFKWIFSYLVMFSWMTFCAYFYSNIEFNEGLKYNDVKQIQSSIDEYAETQSFQMFKMDKEVAINRINKELVLLKETKNNTEAVKKLEEIKNLLSSKVL